MAVANRNTMENAVTETRDELLQILDAQAAVIGIVVGLLRDKGLITNNELNERIEKRAQDMTESEQVLLAIVQRVLLNPH